MAPGLINANPVIYEKKERRVRSVDDNEYTAAESIDQLEVFDILFTFFLSFFNSIQFFFFFLYVPGFSYLLTEKKKT